MYVANAQNILDDFPVGLHSCVGGAEASTILLMPLSKSKMVKDYKMTVPLTISSQITVSIGNVTQ